MARAVMALTALHGSNAGLVSTPAALASFDDADGMSCVVTGNQTIVIYNAPGGSARTVTVPSSVCTHHRLNDALVNAVSIPSPGVLILPKCRAQGWSQGTEGIHLDASGTGLTYITLVDPVD